MNETLLKKLEESVIKLENLKYDSNKIFSEELELIDTIIEEIRIENKKQEKK